MFGVINAWEMETSVYIAKKVLLDKYPACELEIKQGVREVYESEPINEFFGEPVNFHCDAMQCIAFDSKYCNINELKCRSEEMAGTVKRNVYNTCDCAQAKVLAKSITYYLAKYNPMNVMVNESKICRNEFSKKVNENINNPENWEIEVYCDAPDIIIKFSKKKFDEMVSASKTYIYSNAFVGTQKWFCYDDDLVVEKTNIKKNGELCINNEECISDNCNNKVCCNKGEICCPTPGLKGYPCLQGQVCNSYYACEYSNYFNGEKCLYDVECASGICVYNMKGDMGYCVGNFISYACISESDCLSGYECENGECKYVEIEVVEEEEKEIENNGGGICLILPLLSLTGLFLWKRLY